MSADKLNKWAELLLDTGKRNNLINFKDAKMGAVEILAPDFVTLFNHAEHSAVFEVYDPKLEDEEEIFVDEETGEVYSGKRIPKEDYLAAYEKKLKKRQILVYNAYGTPLAALKNIHKKAKSSVEETGVNIAYIAFGFIHWTEKEDGEQTMRAPILLVPVTIENDSPVEPFRVKVTDDEIIVNPTFAFKLQNDYGIKLPEFDEDAGILEYFVQIEELVSKLKWTVSSECKIGIFSFLKINMYQDLKDNAQTIAQNPNVRALLGEGEGKGEPKPEEPAPKASDLLDLHNVVDADSSQAEAIEMALQGKSFVLQGPPGTGKSQTITNMIAECLLDGKKVLFVSEKLAALSVVYDKLKNVGLEEFCLELHSHKANKKQVIEELCHTLKLQKSGVSKQAAKELAAKKEAQEKLDGYASELHAVRPNIRRSLYELYDEVSACRFAPEVSYRVQNIQNKGEEYIEKALSALGQYIDYIPSVGYDYHDNIWYGYVHLDYSYEEVAQVKSDLFDIAELGNTLLSVGKTVRENYGAKIDTLAHAHAFTHFFAIAKDSAFITPALLSTATLQRVTPAVRKLKTLAEEILAKKKLLDEAYDEDIYKLNGQSIHKKLTRQFNGFFSRLFSGEYKQIISDIRLCKKDGKKPRYKFAVQTADNLRIYQQKTFDFNALLASVKNLLGQGCQDVTADFERCIFELETLDKIQSTGADFGQLAAMSQAAFLAEQPTFASLASRYANAFTKHRDAEKRLLSCFDLREYDLYAVSLRELVEKCEGCYENTDKLDNWCEFVKLLNRLTALELRKFVDITLQEKLPVEKIIPAYKKTFYSQWVDAVLHDSPLLLQLARVPHDEAVKKFREKDNLHFEINKAKIKANLSAQRPNLDMIAQGSAIAILLREGEKKRKQKGIRLLLSEVGELAQTLKPCFLMSPLSVSTYLSSDMQFDVVIFDEASQIFPQDAVGAIYRGKQLIVVGDSKQMPPSNFFNAAVDVDADDESEDIADFESILDLCSTAFPQRRLKWHYRSRNEELIAFSNKHFYENDLVTFPSSKTGQAGAGVDYVYVDGVFDRRTKTNRKEAETIVDMVFEHIERSPERSLGVVAFSISQQTLIDRLISKRRQQDSSKDFFFKSDRVEPFFVKNLETVQGDERDTIIFSIAYAKDAQGKLLANFGPVNREGGERRLNVAVTRAKHNVKIVASMHYSDIDLSGSKSLGARLLRDYLDYAENGEEALERVAENNRFARAESPFVEEVFEFLQRSGYAVDRRVGCSSFKIDLAVKRPDSSDYVLAVECDGAAYFSSKTTRDRDRLRQDILERMGWTFYRVWSTDWFRNKPVEKDRLLKAVKAALNAAPKKTKATAQKDVSFEESVVEKPFEFPKYPMADEEALAKKARGDILRVIRGVVDLEAPISEEWLLKRIVFLFGGREKVTGVVREEYNRLTAEYSKYGIFRKNGFLYVQGREIPMLRVPMDGAPPREVKYIATEELANGLRELLKQNVTAEKAGLFRLLANQLGFTRAGDSILSNFEGALAMLSAEIEVHGESLSLKA